MAFSSGSKQASDEDRRVTTPPKRGYAHGQEYRAGCPLVKLHRGGDRPHRAAVAVTVSGERSAPRSSGSTMGEHDPSLQGARDRTPRGGQTRRFFMQNHAREDPQLSPPSDGWLDKFLEIQGLPIPHGAPNTSPHLIRNRNSHRPRPGSSSLCPSWAVSNMTTASRRTRESAQSPCQRPEPRR
jgi:hypothetical protein